MGVNLPEIVTKTHVFRVSIKYLSELMLVCVCVCVCLTVLQNKNRQKTIMPITLELLWSKKYAFVLFKSNFTG